jgi:transmembrane sensor
MVPEEARGDPIGGTMPLDPTIVRQAAQWMARLWSGDASAQDRAACMDWRSQHPDHERAWQRLQAFEDKLTALPRDAALQVLPVTTRPARRRVLHLAVLAAATGSATYVLNGSETWRAARADYRTETGEIRTFTLPDGTQLALSSATAVDLRFSTQERLLELHSGEILVTTAPDPVVPHRPLRVLSRHGIVRALGTRFTVRLGEDNTRVEVFTGAVEVRPRLLPGSAVRIFAGEGSSFDAEQVQSPSPVVDSATAWSRGLLVADGMLLVDFVQALARFRPGLLHCDPAVAGLRVSGVFSLRDTDRALRNLALVLPVSISYRTRYWVVVRASNVNN